MQSAGRFDSPTPSWRMTVTRLPGTLVRCVLVAVWLVGFWAHQVREPWQVGSRWAAEQLTTLGVDRQSFEPLERFVTHWPGYFWRVYGEFVPRPQPVRPAGLLSTDHVSPHRQALADWHMWNTLTVSYAAGLVIPLIVCIFVGPRRFDLLGLRAPSRAGWQLLWLAFVGALPFVLFMASTAEFRTEYIAANQRTALFAPLTLLTLVPEHVLLQGIVLAWLHADRRFPPAELAERSIRWRVLVERGAGAMMTRLGAFVGSLLTPASTLVPIVLGGVLFMLVHAGKNLPETLLSLPGGMALCWIAYRTNGVIIPTLLHLLTAMVAFSWGVWVLGPP